MVNPLVNTGIEMGWHAVKRTFSVVTTLLVFGGLGWLIYVGMIRPHTKPNPTTRNEAEQIINYDVRPSPFGCANFRLMGRKDEDEF